MRIAFIVGQFPKLSETPILSQITGLIDRGHEVDIYANEPSRDPTAHSDVKKYDLFNRVSYWRPQGNYFFTYFRGACLLFALFCRTPVVSLRFLFSFRHEYGRAMVHWILFYLPLLFGCRKKTYDIIHCQFGPQGLSGMFLRDMGILKGRLITSFRGYDMSRYVRKYGVRVYDRLFEKGDFFLPNCGYFKDKLINMGCSEDKIEILYSGINLGTFLFFPRRFNPDKRIRIVTVCRLVEKKGVEYAIRAVSMLSKVYSNVEYTIAGDGPLRSKLKRMIRELDADKIIKLIGWKSQIGIVSILDESDILLAPSVTAIDANQEGIPNAIKEAMAVGLPVIATYHSGIPELVRDGISGFLVPERDPDALLAKLKYLISQPDVCSTIARGGRIFVEKYYDSEKLNNRLIEIYNKISGGADK